MVSPGVESGHHTGDESCSRGGGCIPVGLIDRGAILEETIPVLRTGVGQGAMHVVGSDGIEEGDSRRIGLAPVDFVANEEELQPAGFDNGSGASDGAACVSAGSGTLTGGLSPMPGSSGRAGGVPPAALRCSISPYEAGYRRAFGYHAVPDRIEEREVHGED